MKNNENASSGSPPKAEATGSNPVGCATFQQLSDGFGGHISAASELCSSHDVLQLSPRALAALDWTEGAAIEEPPLRGPNPYDKPGIIYFIGNYDGPVKIGFTNSLEVRLRRLAASSPVPLRVLASMSGTLLDERNYHLSFVADRLHGEWFKRSPQIVAEIDRLNQREIAA